MSERPVECGHCKKPIKVIYKELVDLHMICSQMCEECPLLLQRIKGGVSERLATSPEKDMGLCCGTCGTTLESIQMGNPLGCSDCYLIFDEMIVQEMITTDMLPARVIKGPQRKKSQPFHIGKSPLTPQQMPLSSKLTALNEALNDALKKENYEQAAWLRDQIKDLMGKPDERKKPTS